MFWKVMFVIGVLVYLLSVGVGYVYEGLVYEMGEISYIVGVLVVITTMIGLSYFFALGWKKRLYSKKTTNKFIALFLFSIVIINVVETYEFYGSLLSKGPVTEQAILFTVLFAAIYVTYLAVVFSLFIVAMFKYKKREDQFDKVDKSFWKIFTLYYVFVPALFVISAFTVNLEHLLSRYNWWDRFSLLTFVYTSVYMIGFAFNKSFFCQLFWRISSVVYIITLVPMSLFMSSQYKQDVIYLDLWSYKAAYLIGSFLLLYPLYKYSFTDAVFMKKSVRDKK